MYKAIITIILLTSTWVAQTSPKRDYRHNDTLICYIPMEEYPIFLLNGKTLPPMVAMTVIDPQKIKNIETQKKKHADNIQIKTSRKYADSIHSIVSKYYYLDTPPIEFPGGRNALNRWLNDNVKFPAKAHSSHFVGNVTVQFSIDSTGTVSGIQLARSSGIDLIDQEALRVAQTLPKFDVISSSKKRRIIYRLPIPFHCPGVITIR